MTKVELIQGDCLEKMKDIPDKSVHAIITDMPYGISFSKWDVKHNNTNSALMGTSTAQEKSTLFKSRGKPKNGWSKMDRQIPIEFQEFCESFLSEAKRILYPSGVIVSFTGRQFLHRYIIAGENVGLTHREIIAWDKQKAPFRAQRVGQVIGKRNGDYTDSRRLGNPAPVFEPIVVMSKPYTIGTTITDCYLNFGTGTFDGEVLPTNLISCSRDITNRLHETQKPVLIMESLIKAFSKEDQVILDPFMGSGTTGISCRNLNRNFIGIELDPEYFKIAEKRINENI